MDAGALSAAGAGPLPALPRLDPGPGGDVRPVRGGGGAHRRPGGPGPAPQDREGPPGRRDRGGRPGGGRLLLVRPGSGELLPAPPGPGPRSGPLRPADPAVCQGPGERDLTGKSFSPPQLSNGRKCGKIRATV